MAWIVASVVPLILWIIAKIFPFKPTTPTSAADYDYLKSRYEKWEFFALVPLFIFLPLMTYLFAQLFLVLHNLTIDKDPTIIYYINPANFMWYIPAGLLSLGLIGFLMEAIYTLILGDRYEEYTLFTNLKHGFDGKKIFMPVAWACGTIATIVLFLLTDYSIKIYNDKIVMDDFMNLRSQSYELKQVKFIDFIEMVKTNEGPENRPHYFIKFNDNTYWNTDTGLSDEIKQKEIIDFIINKTNIKADTLRFDPE